MSVVRSLDRTAPAAGEHARERAGGRAQEDAQPRDVASRPEPQAQHHDLAARSVTIGYGREANVVESLDLQVPDGRITAIIGANACGKSTLLRALARLLRPRSGAVVLDGQAIGELPTRRVAQILGLLPQSPVVPEGILVADLVARGRHPHQGPFGRWTAADDAAVDDALERTGIADLAERAVDELSGGQRQRVWIALALAQQPDILLLD